MPRVAFGDTELSFELGPGDVLTEAEPSDNRPEWDTDMFRQRLETTGFDRFISKGKVLVIVNDAFRPTPTGTALLQIKKLYPDFSADYIIAAGNHPAPSEDDLKTIFQDFNPGKGARFFHHDSRKYDEMLEVGESNGFPVYLNRRVFDYPAVMAIGSVEPHYFAGYTGGRKSLIPGLADIETNRRNHAMAISMDARPMCLQGNPVAEDLDHLIRLGKVPDVYSVQLVNGRRRKMIDAFAGPLNDAFAQAIPVAEDVYCFRSEVLFDLVIAELHPPLDRNLYQMQKAVENCSSIVADGGTIIAVSSCNEGIGNSEFYRLAGELDNEDKVLAEAARKNPPLGIHKLSRIIRLRNRISVKALTGLEPDILKTVYWEPAESIEAEMNKLRKKKEKLNILLVRDAGLLVAKLEFT